MNKKNRILTLAASFIAVALILGFAALGIISAVNNAKYADKAETRLSDMISPEESEPLFFDCIEEYESYLLQSASEDNSGATTAVYYSPSSLPEDCVLRCIKVSDSSTVFDYDYTGQSRDIAYDDDNDETLSALFNTVRTVNYYNTQYTFVSDFREYAENMAANINATHYSSTSDQDIYIGNVYADVTVNGITQNVYVGQQIIGWEALSVPTNSGATELISYWYIPGGVTMGSIESIMNFVPHYVSYH